MKELTHKLRKESVGADASVRPCFEGIHKGNKGITLIALIITIVVMMILVGVTITFTIGENGILSQTKEAKFKQEVSQLIEAVNMEKAAIIAKNKGVEPDPYSNEQVDQLTQSIPQKLKEKYINSDKIYVGADGDLYYNLDKVEAKEAEWLNELGIEVGEASGEVFENDFEITDISKEYINSPYDTSKIEKVKLKIVTDITTKFECPIYTKDTALPVVVAEMKSRGRIDENIEINTLEELNVILYNKEITNSSSDIFGAPEANVFYTKDKVDSEDKSIEEIINQFCDLQVLPPEYKNPTAEMFYEVLEGQKIEEKATNLYYYNPKNVTVKIAEGEELIEVETTGAYFTSNYYTVFFNVTANGKYTVELELDGKKSRDTIEITEIYVEKPEEELLQEAIQSSYNTETRKVDLDILEDKLSGRWTTNFNSNTNILKFTKNADGKEYIITEQGRIEKTTLTTVEVLEKLQITQTEDKYDGEWELIGIDGEKLKYVSKENVTQINGTLSGNAAEARDRYKNCENVLNTAAQDSTGIPGAKSITMQDIYNILEVENINIIGQSNLYRFRYDETKQEVVRELYSDPYWLGAINTGKTTIHVIDENGEIYTVYKDTFEPANRLKEKEINALIDFNYKFTENQIEKLSSLNSIDSYWIPERVVIASQNTAIIDYCLVCLEDGEIKFGRWATYDYSTGSDLRGVRAVISL